MLQLHFASSWPENKYHFVCYGCYVKQISTCPICCVKSSVSLVGWKLLWLLSVWWPKMRAKPDWLDESSLTSLSYGFPYGRGILRSLLFTCGARGGQCLCLFVYCCSGQPWPVWATRRLACCSTSAPWPVRSPPSRTWTATRGWRLLPRTIRWATPLRETGCIHARILAFLGPPLLHTAIIPSNQAPHDKKECLSVLTDLACKAIPPSLLFFFSPCSWPAERLHTSKTLCYPCCPGSPPWTSRPRRPAPSVRSCWPRPRKSSASKPPLVRPPSFQ